MNDSLPPSLSLPEKTPHHGKKSAKDPISENTKVNPQQALVGDGVNIGEMKAEAGNTDSSPKLKTSAIQKMLPFLGFAFFAFAGGASSAWMFNGKKLTDLPRLENLENRILALENQPIKGSASPLKENAAKLETQVLALTQELAALKNNPISAMPLAAPENSPSSSTFVAPLLARVEKLEQNQEKGGVSSQKTLKLALTALTRLEALHLAQGAIETNNNLKIPFTLLQKSGLKDEQLIAFVPYLEKTPPSTVELIKHLNAAKKAEIAAQPPVSPAKTSWWDNMKGGLSSLVETRALHQKGGGVDPQHFTKRQSACN